MEERERKREIAVWKTSKIDPENRRKRKREGKRYQCGRQVR